MDKSHVSTGFLDSTHQPVRRAFLGVVGVAVGWGLLLTSIMIVMSFAALGQTKDEVLVMNIDDPIQLIAVQMTLDLDDFWTEEAFRSKIAQLMEEVAFQTDPNLPRLIVFPEDVGLMLVAQGLQKRMGAVDSIEVAIETAVRAHVIPLFFIKWWRDLSWVPALFLHKHKSIAKTYFTVFSEMARTYEAYIVAGSVILPPYEIVDGDVLWKKGPIEHRVYNTSYLFDPQGKVVGKQDKVYLIDLEKEAALDLKAGALENLAVFPTSLGNIGIAICLDAFQDDVIDRLLELDAEILVQPSANPGPWNQEQQLDWMRSSYARTVVEGKFPYAINPMLNGPLWDISFYGQSSIVASNPEGLAAPLMTGYADLEPKEGFIALAKSDDQEEILVVTVSRPESIIEK